MEIKLKLMGEDNYDYILKPLEYLYLTRSVLILLRVYYIYN